MTGDTLICIGFMFIGVALVCGVSEVIIEISERVKRKKIEKIARFMAKDKRYRSEFIRSVNRCRESIDE